jgi:RecB family exonuclease
VADWFVATEATRQAVAKPVNFEMKATHVIHDPPFTLTAKADRIDRDTTDGRLHIYDYKTGHVPTAGEQQAFDKQLLLEAAMASDGAFEALPADDVARAMFIGVGGSAKEVLAPLDKAPPDTVWAEFIKLISAYFEPSQGYTARRAMFKETDHSDYDQLARFGEWDTTQEPQPEDLA